MGGHRALRNLVLYISSFLVLVGNASPALLPSVLVFESSAYFSSLSESGRVFGILELVHCGEPDYCRSLDESFRRRVLAVVGQPFNITFLERLPALQLVHSTSYMYPRLSQVPSRAVVASYMPAWRDVYGVEPIAEFLIAAAFQWNYRLREKRDQFVACAWGDDAPQRCPSTQQLTGHPVLMNQTMGILGYGKIGKAVAKRSAALGMRTIATKLHGPFFPPPAPLTWLSDDNDRLLRESDFVVLTLPGSAPNIINHTSLRLMKSTSVVLPISAGTVDFDALYTALSRRVIGGAVIDVWPHGCWHFPDMECGAPYGRKAEPYGTEQIQKLDNVIALPGMAMRDDKFWASSALWVLENLIALIKGTPLLGIVRNATDLAEAGGLLV